MRVERQLSVFLENRSGVLGTLAADLAAHGISIRALTVANLVDHSVVRLVVSDPKAALHLFGERGLLAVQSHILAIEIPDEAGTLANTARRLARAGVNIDYAYGSGPADGGQAMLYVHPSDLRKARAALATRPSRRPRAAPRSRRVTRGRPTRAAR